MTTIEPHDNNGLKSALSRFRARPVSLMTGVALTFLALGAAAGTGGTRLVERWRPQPVMILQVTPVNRLQADSPAAIKGRVTEIFGNKFILDDGNGHALVDLGPRGEDANIVINGEIVTVQGRFERGALHAEVLAHSDGRMDAFGPPPPPDRRPPQPRDRIAGPPPPPPPGPVEGNALPLPPPPPGPLGYSAPPPPAR